MSKDQKAMDKALTTLAKTTGEIKTLTTKNPKLLDPFTARALQTIGSDLQHMLIQCLLKQHQPEHQDQPKRPRPTLHSGRRRVYTGTRPG